MRQPFPARRLLLIGVFAGLAQAHEPITTKLTWTREISRIFYRRCVSCHREGGAAPMSLATYDEARPWAKAIKEEVLERRMPPWGAVKGFGDFRNDPSLSEPEIERIVNWVEGGAPKGEEIHLPAAPVMPAATVGAAPRGPALALRGGVSLSRTVIARGLRLRGIPPGGETRITARRPDGTVEPLLWLRNRRPNHPDAYYFREPLTLPRGTRIQVEGSPADLLIDDG